MTTMAENERLAVLENQYNLLQRDVSEIKSDVKALVITQNSLLTTLAVREEADRVASSTRASTGVWVRSFVPWLITGVAATLALVNTIVRLFH
jgi:hypothetical protein